MIVSATLEEIVEGVTKLREALEWALDELDQVGNKARGVAYPQFPGLEGRDDAARRYVEARQLLRRMTQQQRSEAK